MDRLRAFVYRSPDDGDLCWDCYVCARREITEAEAPGRYSFNGLPICRVCHAPVEQMTPGDKADAVEMNRQTYDTEES